MAWGWEFEAIFLGKSYFEKHSRNSGTAMATLREEQEGRHTPIKLASWEYFF